MDKETIEKVKFEEVSTCPHCGAMTEERFIGDEGWTFCSEDCGCLEGDRLVTKYLCLTCYELKDSEKCACT